MRHTLAALLAVASLTSAAAAQTEPASTAAPAQATPPAQSEIGAAVAKDMDAMMTLYRDLHANPELSLKEGLADLVAWGDQQTSVSRVEDAHQELVVKGLIV